MLQLRIVMTLGMTLSTLVLFVVSVTGCGSAERRNPGVAPSANLGQQEQVQRLARYLTGTFSNEDQATEDDEYLSVNLVVQPIWRERIDGPWLYVEQSVAGSVEPYRQRIYRISPNTDGSLRSDVFELPDPAAFAGAWDHVESFGALTPEVLALKEGCGVALSFDPRADLFSGATTGTNCASVLRGASYATSLVEITQDEVRSWDRGFDVQGQQVWGPKKGAYIYRRVVPETERTAE